MDKFIRRLIPQAVGITCMIIGWWISIVNVGLDKFVSSTIVNKWTLIGLMLIIVGAYIPQIWIFILNKLNK